MSDRAVSEGQGMVNIPLDIIRHRKRQKLDFISQLQLLCSFIFS
jgi:hypothetical protein